MDKIIENPELALNRHADDLDIWDWAEAYPVLNSDQICVGVVSAYGSPGDVLAGKYNGEIYSDVDQAYIEAE